MRPNIILISLSAFIALLYGYSGLMEIRAIMAPALKSNASALNIAPPELAAAFRHGEFQQARDYSLWGIQKPESPASSLASGSSQSSSPTQPLFAVKDFDGVPAVYSIKDEKYRWELYGLYKEQSPWKAVLFNPSLARAKDGGWRKLCAGDHLDDQLTLIKIENDTVVVAFEQGNTTFELRLFPYSIPPTKPRSKGKE